MWEETEAVTPRVTIYSGSHVVPVRTTLIPAYFDAAAGAVVYNKYVYRTAYTPDTLTSATINSTLQLTSKETAQLVADFREANSAHRDPDVWLIETTFEITNDGKGSYGEYFKFKPVGNFAGTLASDGTVTYSIQKNTTSRTYTLNLVTLYFAKEDLTQPDKIGLPNGGYYYYNAVSKTHMSKLTGSVVWLNKD